MKTIVMAIAAAGMLVLGSSASAWAHGPHHGSRGAHGRLHAELGQRAFQRELLHWHMHQFPMTGHQHRLLHQSLDHQAYHDHRVHRSFHRHHDRHHHGHHHHHRHPHHRSSISIGGSGFYLQFGR